MRSKIKEFFNFKKNKNLDVKDKEQKENKEKFVKEVLEKFKSRRSIRKFSKTPIEWEIIYNIIEAGMNAPCAGNIQNCKVIVVEDKKTKNEIGKAASQQYWLSDAPVLLIVVRDDSHICELYPKEGKIYCIQNSAALIENILMMAHFYDLGACWVESYDNSVLKEILNVPVNLTIDAIIPIGFPMENPKVSKQPLVSSVFFEKYGNRRRIPESF